MNEAPVFDILDNIRTFHEKCLKEINNERDNIEQWTTQVSDSRPISLEDIERWKWEEKRREEERRQLQQLRREDADFNDRIWKLEMFARNIPMPESVLKS